MSASVPKEQPASIVNVAIVATDEARHAALVDVVAAAGHTIVSENDADVVLVDGDASPEQIAATLSAVARGQTVRPAANRAHHGFEELTDRVAHPLLTPREVEVLAAIGAGQSNKAIARQLGISLHTVKFHIESLFRKLSARTRAEAVAKGLERRAGETVEL